MEIVIIRFAQYHAALTGRLFIDGRHVADTLEHAGHCLPTGTYRLEKRFNRHERGYDYVVGGDRPLSGVCGIYGRFRDRVAVGESPCQGFLLHSTAVFAALRHRIKQAFARRHTVTVIIRRVTAPGDVRRMIDLGRAE